jgi:hypothetical protein
MGNCDLDNIVPQGKEVLFTSGEDFKQMNVCKKGLCYVVFVIFRPGFFKDENFC